MKKNISINLQGIIFHIEEDGYEQLSRYLTSIRTYFSNYEGHEEIVADIESRIAEIFAARLAPGKQVISMEDVQYLIARMGDVTDFEILEPMEEEMPYMSAATQAPGAGPEAEAYTSAPYAGPKKLYRDINHKVLGGVCSGIANYLNVDMVWIRLAFALLVLGIPFTHGASGFGFVLYIILWIAMPASAALPDTTVKKLFRDPEDKKLAGVASGIAKYFGVDVAVIRILFLALIFAGGFGLLAYIVLWIAVPQAVTLTERMQMQGDPVTLAGIEKTLKDNLDMKDHNGEETTLARVILLPVRLVSQIIHWLGNAFGPILGFLITLIRIGAGVFLLVLSIGLTIALLMTLFYTLGWIAEPQSISFGDYPASVFLEGFPRLGLVAGFFVGIIPLIFLVFLAIGLLAKRFFVRPFVGWSMFGLWLVGVFVLIATSVTYAANFKRSGEVTTTKTVPVGNYQTLTLDAYDLDTEYDRVYVDVREAEGDNVEIIQTVEAKGRTEHEAQANARMVSYRVVQKDSVLRFDNSYEFKPGAAFRDQNLEIKLMLPKNKKLRLTNEFIYMLPSATFDREYSNEKIARNLWQVKGDMLECLTCATDTLDTEADSNIGDIDVAAFGEGESVLRDLNEYNSNSQRYNFSNFNHISVAGPYHVQLTQGNNYSVQVRAGQKELKRVEMEQNGDELVINYQDRTINLLSDTEPILIQITAPDITKIDLSGAIKADVNGITSSNLEVSLTGATKAAFNVRTRTLKADIAGASASKFMGTTDSFDVNAAGACSIEADQLRARQVDIDADGMTVAKVYASATLRAEASGASQIKYKGNPTDTRINANGASKVERL
ncbi:PspC domain-containing protein [Pontibacter liquoris]|uniref:PspC domain-containing protein n=1 Tax=Pontibacter liquoris TaxID=2905677 RepID=UPI001FA7A726|nr:PspC domain-containing protein [Pontibacter liquoris]